MVWPVFLVFIVEIVLIGLWFFLISEFVFVNFLLSLIVHETLWSVLLFLYSQELCYQCL